MAGQNGRGFGTRVQVIYFSPSGGQSWLTSRLPVLAITANRNSQGGTAVSLVMTSPITAAPERPWRPGGGPSNTPPVVRWCVDQSVASARVQVLTGHPDRMALPEARALPRAAADRGAGERGPPTVTKIPSAITSSEED